MPSKRSKPERPKAAPAGPITDAIRAHKKTGGPHPLDAARQTWGAVRALETHEPAVRDLRAFVDAASGPLARAITSMEEWTRRVPPVDRVGLRHDYRAETLRRLHEIEAALAALPAFPAIPCAPTKRGAPRQNHARDLVIAMLARIGARPVPVEVAYYLKQISNEQVSAKHVTRILHTLIERDEGRSDGDRVIEGSPVGTQRPAIQK